MQEEVNNKTVTLAIRTTKLTARALGMAIGKYLNARKQKKTYKKNLQNQAKENQKKMGRLTVKELAAQDAGMTNIEINSKNIKAFERYARKYGVSYALKKDRTKDPPVYLVFFKGRDQDAIHSAFREFSAAQIKQANKDTIHKKLTRYRGIAQKLAKRIKHKHQEQSL